MPCPQWVSLLRCRGYVRAGLDDFWQDCGAGVNGSFHSKSGDPLIDTHRFPSMKDMVAFATSRGLEVGWYANNCHCAEHNLSDSAFVDLTVQKTVEALVAFNFSGLKLDGCGPANNLTRWAEVINASGHAMLVENCHWGQTVPHGKPRQESSRMLGVSPEDDGYCIGLHTPSECPYNFYRTSGDGINSFERVHHNVHSLVPYLQEPPLSKPGAWAYGDGMELGRMSGPYREAEDRTIFGWYVVTSSPLYLGHNVSDDETNARVWPIVSNIEAIAINQQWSGHPGRLVKTWGPSTTSNTRWPLGRAVYNVSCDISDDTQLGWEYDAETMQLRSPSGKCMDYKAADNRQIWVVDCDEAHGGIQAQRWEFGAKDSSGFASLHTTTSNKNSLSIPGAQNSVGFARNGVKGLTTRFRIDPKTRQLQSESGSCLATRAINPVKESATYEAWSKNLKVGLAVFLVNNGLPANLTIGLAELGIHGAVAVRDVWRRQNNGTIGADGHIVVELGVHASALLVLHSIQL